MFAHGAQLERMRPTSTELTTHCTPPAGDLRYAVEWQTQVEMFLAVRKRRYSANKRFNFLNETHYSG